MVLLHGSTDFHSTAGPGFVRRQDCFVRTRLYAHAPGRQGLRVATQQWPHCAPVARRMHHPLRRLKPIPKIRASRTSFSTHSLPTPPRVHSSWHVVTSPRSTSTTGSDTSLSLLICCDYFGAHTYEKVDNPGTFVHTNWTGHGVCVLSNF